MRGKECIKCEHLFDCPGKPTDRECLHFKERDNERKQIRKQEDKAR